MCLRLAGVVHLAALLCLGIAYVEDGFDGTIIATGLILALVSLLAPLKGAAGKIESASPEVRHESRTSLLLMPERISPPKARAATAMVASALAAAGRRGSVDPQRQAWADLMGRVSHELRTPLNAVLGFSDIMGRELFGPLGNARYKEYVSHIHESGRELLKSAEDTLALTAILADPKRAAPSEPVDLAELAAEAFGFFSGIASARGLWLDLHVPHGLEVIGERRALRQALLNLFSEAIARSGDHASIEIRAWASGDVAHIEVRAEGGVSERPMEGLSVCLARALLELQGSSLIEIDDGAEGWRAVTLLALAAQQDFFVAVPMQKQHREVDCLAA